MVSPISAIGIEPISSYSPYQTEGISPRSCIYKKIIKEFLEEYAVYKKEKANKIEAVCKSDNSNNNDNTLNTETLKTGKINSPLSEQRLGPPVGFEMENFSYFDYFECLFGKNL